MKKRLAAAVNLDKSSKAPVELHVQQSVSFIGPASRENPMSNVRQKLMGKVVFPDKIKWQRITLNLIGKAGIRMEVPVRLLPKGAREYTDFELPEDDEETHVETTIVLCDIEKELIFNGESTIEFGIHLPADLPPSIQAKHAFVTYSLFLNLSAGPLTRKHRIERVVEIRRHYLPAPGVVIPSNEHHGVDRWFTWSAEVPKAVAVEAGEVVMALRWSIEKERVTVDRVELVLIRLDHYRFNTRAGLCTLPAQEIDVASDVYHPTSADDSETHFVRAPLPRDMSTRHFDPFLEISHRLAVTVHFSNKDPAARPVVLNFGIIITEYPEQDHDQPTLLHNMTRCQSHASACNSAGGDDAVPIDVQLPEYTPRYDERSPTGQQSN